MCRAAIRRRLLPKFMLSKRCRRAGGQDSKLKAQVCMLHRLHALNAARGGRRYGSTSTFHYGNRALLSRSAYVFQSRLRIFGLDILALHYQYGVPTDRPRIRALLRGSQYSLNYNERVILHSPHLPCSERLKSSVRGAEKILWTHEEQEQEQRTCGIQEQNSIRRIICLSLATTVSSLFLRPARPAYHLVQ